MPELSLCTATIQYMSEGNSPNDYIMFGITKEHFGLITCLGREKYDWSVNLSSGKKWSNNENSNYGEPAKVKDMFTCVVNWKAGVVKFMHNKKDLGVAF